MWENLDLSLGEVIIIIFVLYFVIKHAVKNGIKAAYDEITKDKNFYQRFIIKHQNQKKNKQNIKQVNDKNTEKN